MSKALSVPERAFITAYLKNMNGTQAYLQIRPKTRADTANRYASRLLSNVHIKAEIDRRMSKCESSSTRTKDIILDRYDSLSKKAEDKGQIQTALNCTKETAVLMGFYGAESNDGYVQLIQQITNIQINNNSKE